MVAEQAKIPLGFADNFGVFVMLANGFILTAMLWGAFLAFLIDHRFGASSVTLAICSALSFFGVIHSVLPTGGIYLPWSAALHGSVAPYHWAAAYALVAVMIVALGATRRSADARGGLAA